MLNQEVEFDHLYFDSVPPNHDPEITEFEYKPLLMSSSSDVTLEIVEGPRGMVLSEDNAVKWTVPQKTGFAYVPVTIQASDTAGRVVQQHFRISLGGDNQTLPTDPKLLSKRFRIPDEKYWNLPELKMTRGERPPIEFNSPVVATSVGGGGKYLIAKTLEGEQLQIINTQDGTVRSIPFQGDPSCFAASANHLVTFEPKHRIFHRWNLETGKKELSVPCQFAQQILFVRIGHSTGGPIFVGIESEERSFSEQERSFELLSVSLDSLNLDRKETISRTNEVMRTGINCIPNRVRISGDGRMITTPTGGEQSVILSRNQDDWTAYAIDSNATPVVPSYHGGFTLTTSDVYEHALLRSGSAYGMAGTGGKFTLKYGQSVEGLKSGAPRSDIYLLTKFDPLGNPKSYLRSVESKVDFELEPEGFLANRIELSQPGRLTYDQRVLPLPESKQILYFSTDGLKLNFMEFDYWLKLKKSTADFVEFRNGQPPIPATAGSSVRWTFDIESSTSGKFVANVYGPSGIKVSGNRVIWKVPKDFLDPYANAKLVVRADGQTIVRYLTFVFPENRARAEYFSKFLQ
ncbi:MAG: hypothetical protein AAF939_16525 [Planctomycetota bacterium]